jgi:hypothetical protein
MLISFVESRRNTLQSCSRYRIRVFASPTSRVLIIFATLQAVQNVSSSDVATSLSHISRLFDAKQSHCVVCAAPTASAAISAFLHEQCHFDDVTHTADAGEIFA